MYLLNDFAIGNLILASEGRGKTETQAGAQADRTSDYYDCPLRLLGSADDDACHKIACSCSLLDPFALLI